MDTADLPRVRFERYADDAILYCRSERQAGEVLEAIRGRFAQCGLELHPTKTRIVYCKDDDRLGKFEHIKFDFLGYTFQPRWAKNRWGKFFTSFLPAISVRAAQAIRQTISAWRMASTRNNQRLEDLARLANPAVRGWMNYYGRFYRSKCVQVLRHLNVALAAWVRWKYKRFRRRERASMHWLGCIARRDPKLFVLWELGVRLEGKSRMRREFHVRFCEGEGVRLPSATRLIVGFQHKSDAERFLEELRERFRKFNLELHPDKTRLLEFGPLAAENRRRGGRGKPETFNFLGFTHICGKKRSNGRFTVLRQTMAKRLQAKLSEVKAELRRRWHDPTPMVGQWLQSVVRGHLRYYGVPMNHRALALFRFRAGWLWHRALGRRSQKARVSWERMRRLIDQWLPAASVCHPYPLRRMGVIT